MINSMTAFASAENNADRINVNIEIRAYNSRYLDIVLRTPQGFLPLEDRIKRLVGQRLARGRVEVMVKVKHDTGDHIAFEIDKPKAMGLAAAMDQLREVLHIKEAIPLEMLISQGNLIKPVEEAVDWEAGWRVIQEGLNEALDGLQAMRQREGAAIAGDFEQRLTTLDAGVVRIESDSHVLPEIYRERLKTRIAKLTQDSFEVDEGRIAQEAAFLADRSDISEEIVRLRSHIEQFRCLMAAPEPAGRKLNFLLQELNRELNTIGSKTDKAAVSHLVVDLKSELEKIREQVQNIE